jgi:hypothetical protein
MTLRARLGVIAAVASLMLAAAWGARAETKADDAAVARTRKTVRMLDDIYKTAVVLITDKYVHKEDDFPAGGAAVALFAAVKQKGWHDVRLLDVTGQPYEEKNAPKDDFEKAATKAFSTGGKDYYEQVVSINGQPHLRAATPIPVVSKKCIMCHPHYKDAKEGAAIGALSYTLKIE